MEITQYIQPLLKWWKLILLACILAGVSSYMLVSQQPPVYETHTTLVIGRAVYEPNPSYGELGIATQLATYYADIAQREVVKNATMEALNLKWLPDYFVQVVPNSQLIEIVVTDTDPQRAQVVANELANQLTKQTPTTQGLIEAEQQTFIDEQLALLETQIADTLDEIARMEEELGELNSARQIANTQSGIAALQQKLLTLQTNYATLLGSSTGKALNSLTVVEAAALPRRPVGPNSLMTIMLSIAIAFAISSGAAYLIEYLDDTFKTSEEITSVLGLPVLGHIAQIDKNSEAGVYVEKNPDSAIAEAYRSVCLNLEFVDMDKETKTVLISSMSPEDGKSFFATNLAMSLSESGKKVVLLDADLRRPSVHTILEVPNNRGLSEIFRGEISIDEVIDPIYHNDVGVITAGGFIPNPSAVLGSKKMDRILDDLRFKSDFIVIDAAPFPVSDSKMLSTKADVVLLVVRYGKTRKSLARDIIKQMRQVDANISGVIFNGIPNNNNYLKAYHYYYGPEGSEKKRSKGGFKVPVLGITLRNPLKVKRSAISEHESQVVDSK
jgi:non-specific protein-tyrosine kinase